MKPWDGVVLTQQEAYQHLCEILKQQEVLQNEARRFAKEHKLVLVQRHLDSPPETLNPKYLDPAARRPTFKSDITQEEVDELMPGYGYTASDFAGQDIYDAWVPSQMC